MPGEGKRLHLDRIERSRRALPGRDVETLDPFREAPRRLGFSPVIAACVRGGGIAIDHADTEVEILNVEKPPLGESLHEGVLRVDLGLTFAGDGVAALLEHHQIISGARGHGCLLVAGLGTSGPCARLLWSGKIERATESGAAASSGWPAVMSGCAIRQRVVFGSTRPGPMLPGPMLPGPMLPVRALPGRSSLRGHPRYQAQ